MNGTKPPVDRLRRKILVELLIIFALVLNTRALGYVYRKAPAWAKRNLFDRFHDPESGEEGFQPVITEIGEAVRALRVEPGLNIAAFGMLLFHWGAGAMTAYLTAAALGVHVSISTVARALAGAFVLAGVPLSTAAAISLLTRLATYWFEVIVCVPVALRFGYKEFLTKYFGG